MFGLLLMAMAVVSLAIGCEEPNYKAYTGLWCPSLEQNDDGTYNRNPISMEASLMLSVFSDNAKLSDKESDALTRDWMRWKDDVLPKRYYHVLRNSHGNRELWTYDYRRVQNKNEEFELAWSLEYVLDDYLTIWNISGGKTAWAIFYATDPSIDRARYLKGDVEYRDWKNGVIWPPGPAINLGRRK